MDYGTGHGGGIITRKIQYTTRAIAFKIQRILENAMHFLTPENWKFSRILIARNVACEIFNFAACKKISDFLQLQIFDLQTSKSKISIVSTAIAFCVVFSLMPLAGAAENPNLNTDNTMISSNAIANLNLTGLSSTEIAKLQTWLKEKNFNTSIKDGNLTIGATGENVAQLQKWLKEHNFYAGEIDGQFGNATEQAVKLFQNSTGIVEDGWVGIQTLQAMEKWDQTNESETSDESSKTGSDQKTVTSTSSSTKKYSTKTTKSTSNYSKYSYSSRKGTGDCWTNSAILYNQLTSSGVKARIIQYSTSLSSRHRSVQIYQNGAWMDYNYKVNGYAKRYYATSSKPGATVIT